MTGSAPTSWAKIEARLNGFLNRTSRTASSEPKNASLLVGFVDNPTEGESIYGSSLVIRGWHMFDGQPALAVAARLDGESVVARAHVGSEPRPDVAEILDRPEAEDSGWKLEIEVPEMRLGESARVRIAVWGAMEQSPVILPPITVKLLSAGESTEVATSDTTAPPVGYIDLPAEDSEVPRGVVRVVGWAYAPGEPVDRVEILLDGASCGYARLGLPRPDLIGPTFNPHARLAGFEHLVDCSRVDAHRATAQLTAVIRQGEDEPLRLAERTIHFSPSPSSDCSQEDRCPPASSRSKRPVIAEQNRSLDLVCFTHDLGYGGGQLWLSELLDKAGAGRQFPCTVVAPRSGPLLDDLERMQVEVHVTEDYPLKDADAYEGRVAEMSAWLAGREHNAALVNTFGAFFGADVAIRNGLPVAWGIHESWEPSEAFWYAAFPPGHVHPSIRARALWALRHAGALVFEANATRNLYAPFSAAGRAIKVPYGIDTSAIDRYAEATSREAARRSIGIEDDRRLILVMGTIEPRKCQTMIAEAFVSVGGQQSNAILAFVGDTGSHYAAALKQYVEEIGAADSTWVVPVVADTYRWYRAADVLLCASDVESLPRSVLEVMCFGVPVAATDVFGLSELITHRETGYLFPTGSIGALSETMQLLLSAPEADLARIGAAGRRVILEHHDSKGYASRLVQILHSLTREPPGQYYPEAIF